MPERTVKSNTVAVKPPEPKISETTQRLLNLVFIFNSSLRPLRTDEIISDTDLGYGSSNQASDERKFRRDRETLAERGFFIVEHKEAGNAENTFSSWELDRTATFAVGGLISENDTYTLLNLIDAELARPGSPWQVPLHSVRTKLLRLAHTRENGTSVVISSVSELVWTAFALKRSITIVYSNAQEEETKRELCIYHLFENAGEEYICGFDHKSNSIRTFKVSRIARVVKLGKSYEIPEDFDALDYEFLPFDFSRETPVTASFVISRKLTPLEITQLTHDRGTLEQNGDKLIWKIAIRDITAAARFALARSSWGMRPVAPQTLVDAWTAEIKDAVMAHA